MIDLWLNGNSADTTGILLHSHRTFNRAWLAPCIAVS